MGKNLKVWTVKAGSLTRHYFTEHHAEQMAAALRANGMLVEVTQGWLKDDALTRLAVAQ